MELKEAIHIAKKILGCHAHATCTGLCSGCKYNFNDKELDDALRIILRKLGIKNV